MQTNQTRREWLKLSAFSAAALGFSTVGVPERTQAQTSSDKVIKLSSNENPYGFSPRAKKALLEAMSGGSRYAAPELVAKLEQEIAAREGLKPENVILGAGSGEVLCMAAALCGAKEIVAPDPTFPTLMRYAENFGAKIKNVPLNDRFEHNLAEMARQTNSETALVYVCNPNNPTGGLTPFDSLRTFCTDTAKRTLVFADEAYLEYTDDFPRNSMIELVRRGENVIVSRTFSKIYGMAGLRVGYGLAPMELAQKLRRFRMTWPNPVSLTAALAAYGDREFITESKRQNDAVRRAFLGEMDKMGFKYAPSSANFVWLEIGAGLKDLGDRMKSYNILVRSSGERMRVTLGTPDEMQAFVRALREIKANSKS